MRRRVLSQVTRTLTRTVSLSKIVMTARTTQIYLPHLMILKKGTLKIRVTTQVKVIRVTRVRKRNLPLRIVSVRTTTVCLVLRWDRSMGRVSANLLLTIIIIVKIALEATVMMRRTTMISN